MKQPRIAVCLWSIPWEGKGVYRPMRVPPAKRSPYTQPLGNSPEIDSRIDIGADSMDGSAAKLMGRGGDKEMGRTIAMPVFSLSPPLLISPSISSRVGGL